MSGDFAYQAEKYIEDISDALARAGLLAWVVAAGWLACPFAVATVLNPKDIIGAQYKLQGLRVPSGFTAQQLGFGLIEALVALGVLVLLQLVFTVLFYRAAKMDGAAAATPVLFPLALLVVGIVGNAAWFAGTGGRFDLAGCIIGLTSTALTVGAELVCNWLGKEFVFGPGSAAQAPLSMLSGPAWSAQAAGPVFYHIPE